MVSSDKKELSVVTEHGTITLNKVWYALIFIPKCTNMHVYPG